MDIRKQVGVNLQRLRREKGWSQEALAFESGLHRTYVSGIERGVRNPTLLILDKLAKTFGLAPDELLVDKSGPSKRGRSRA